MPKPVEFYFDYASPWAFLVNEILDRRLASVPIVYKPVYIRGLEMFSKGLPFVQNKLRYLGIDWERCAKREGVEGSTPSEFPINGLYALRGAVYTLEAGSFEAYHRRVFRAVWQEDVSIADKQKVIALAADAGVDVDAFAAGIERPEVKAKLRADTEAAEAAGVFGLPSFFVEGELFWGYDRLDHVAESARAANEHE